MYSSEVERKSNWIMHLYRMTMLYFCGKENPTIEELERAQRNAMIGLRISSVSTIIWIIALAILIPIYLSK